MERQATPAPQRGENYLNGTSKSLKSQWEYALEFEQAMREAGVDFPDRIISDGKIHRFKPRGKRKPSGWYVFYGYAGAFGDWRQNIKEKWSTQNPSLTPREREQMMEEREKAHKAFQEEVVCKNQEASDVAVKGWTGFAETGASAYLLKKKVDAVGIRFGQGCMVMPLCDAEGKMWSYQKIYDHGGKYLLEGGRKKGCFHVLGQIQDGKPIKVTEGYSTGSSVYMATGDTVVVAIDAGNIEPVIASLKQKYPNSTITIAGDDDWHKPINTGKIKAEEAAKLHDCQVILPTFKNREKYNDLPDDQKPTDWNDLHVLEGIDEVIRQLKQNPDDSWSEPLPIKNDLLPVQAFDLGLMPPVLRPFVEDCAFRMQCPRDYIGVSVISVISSLIGSACGIKPKRYDDWIVISNLWGGIIGHPSTLKTPATNEAFAPLHHIEKEAMQAYQKEMKEWEIKGKVAKIREESVKSDLKSKIKQNPNLSDAEVLKLYSQQVKEIPKPVCKRYKTNDSTIEKVHELMSENPRGILVYRDELVGLMMGWEKEGHESDRAFYLESWNSYGSFTVDRIGRGTIHVDNICASIFGCTQPDKMTGYIQKNIFSLENDGLVQRFNLLIYPDALKEWQYVDQPPHQDAKKAYHDLARKIAQDDFFDSIYFDDDILSGEPSIQIVKDKRCFSYDDEAQDIFIEWLTNLEKRLKGFEEPVIIQHLSKYRKLMPALSFIFHVIDLAGGQTKRGKISKECAIRAICWCEYLESHARRIYEMALNVSTQAASVLSKRIEQGKLDPIFTIRDITRKGWSVIGQDTELAKSACEELIKAGWIREKITPPTKTNKGKTEYVINPRIKITKEEREPDESVS